MEKDGVSDKKKTVVAALIEGKRLANELKRQLKLSSKETCCGLVESILSSYEKAITLLSLIDGASSQIAVGELFEAPNSVVGSPTSEGSDQNSKYQLKNCKKRKTLPRRSEHVRVCSVTAQPDDDGYQWRKYGQKDILGANHPRAYFRCRHRKTQGCLATKQVQRADEDPMIVEVTYSGNHSCRQERLKQSRVMEEERMRLPTSSFSFPSTPIEYENIEPHLTPESYFSLSPSLVNDFGIGHSLQNSDSDFAEIIPDFDLCMDAVDFDPDLLDASEYFC